MQQKIIYDPGLQLAFDIPNHLGITMEELLLPHKRGRINGQKQKNHFFRSIFTFLHNIRDNSV
jgi:hypothetical protein